MDNGAKSILEGIDHGKRLILYRKLFAISEVILIIFLVLCEDLGSVLENQRARGICRSFVEIVWNSVRNI